MLYRDIAPFVAVIGPFLAFAQFLVLAVWLGMVLLSPATLEGLGETKITKLRRLRRSFVRLLYRVLIAFMCLLPLAILGFVGIQMRVIEPRFIVFMLSLMAGIWWLCVVFGSLAHAWFALKYLEE